MPARRSARSNRPTGESGQATLLLLGLIATLLVGVAVLWAFGQAFGAKARHQRGADLAAVSAAQVMRRTYPRLFEPALLSSGIPNPRHLSTAAYLALARAAALSAARRNGVRVRASDVSFPGGSFAPTRVSVIARGASEVDVPHQRPTHRRHIHVRARATAELVSAATPDLPQSASGGGYSGPLAYRQGKPMRPDVAEAFDRMAQAARHQAGLLLSVTSGYRSDSEQARLFAAHPDPKWVAPPGKSLHRLGTELDLGPPAAYGWLRENARRFGFIQRYVWEPWHYGYVHNAGSGSVGFGRVRGSDGRSTLPGFVPASLAPLLTRAAQRWNISSALLAAQLYAESNFNPFAVSPAGARGIAQFMPGTARSLGLKDAFDPQQSIDAQGHLMRDLLRRFASVPLALAAYNAGSAAVARCMCIPPFPETRAYVARILGLLGGAGDSATPALEVRLVE